MIMPIHLYGTKVWDGPAKKITKFDDKLAGLIRDMFETMHNADGIGLAANQVGTSDVACGDGYFGDGRLRR